MNIENATFSTIFPQNLPRLFVLMIFISSSNMGHVGSKSRSLAQIKAKPVNDLKTTWYSLSVLIKLDKYICVVSKSNSKMSHIGHKLSHKVKLKEIHDRPLEAIQFTRFS